MITILFKKHKQVRKHFGAILRYRCKFEAYRTFKLCIKEFWVRVTSNDYYFVKTSSYWLSLRGD